MVTKIVADRVYEFERVVGRNGLTGEAFSYHVKMVLGDGDIVYVLNRGYEIIPNMPWNRIGAGLRVNKMIIGPEPDDEELLAEFGSYGNRDDQMIWPTGMARDSGDLLYITDEWRNRVSVFTGGGEFRGVWGTAGAGEGQFDGPTGICTDADENLLIVDSRNHRVQKYTREGRFLGQWGSAGSGEGQLNTPWGIGLDDQGNVYVADTNNHRVQKFTPDGAFLASFGSFGTGSGQLRYPSDVCVDPDGDVYVADWANDRVLMFSPEGKFMTSFVGDARELSKWAKMTVSANPDVVRRRREVGDDVSKEWTLNMPTGVTFDAAKTRLMILDTQRGRIQVYTKNKNYLEPQRNL